MSGNTRGKIKEELEGIHRNIDWVRVHSQKIQIMLEDTHPEIHTFFQSLINEMDVLDDGLQRIYATW